MAMPVLRFILLSSIIALLGLPPVVAADVTAEFSKTTPQASMHAHFGLKEAFKAALRSGKIRQVTQHLKQNVNNMAAPTRIQGTSGSFSAGRSNVFLDMNTWTPFMKVCNADEWKDFERYESVFRQSIATKPMNVKQTFSHPNPIHWQRLYTIISYLFIRV